MAYLARFQQLIKPTTSANYRSSSVNCRATSTNAELRELLHRASDDFKAAQGVQSPLAAVAPGPFAAGSQLAKLYLHGGIFHGDAEMSEWWDRIGPNNRQMIQYEFRMYESRVRNVVVELKKVIEAGREGGRLPTR